MNPNPFAVRNAIRVRQVFSVQHCVSGAVGEVECNLSALTWSNSQSGCTKALSRPLSSADLPASVSFSSGQHAKWFQAGPLPSPTRIEQRHCWLNKAVMALARAVFSAAVLNLSRKRIKDGQEIGEGCSPSCRLIS